jgi:hypothetical protein
MKGVKKKKSDVTYSRRRIIERIETMDVSVSVSVSVSVFVYMSVFASQEG